MKSIVNWFEAAKPSPGVDDLCVQIGCHLEECGELLDALGMHKVADEVLQRANWFKTKHPPVLNGLKFDITCNERLAQILDAVADQHVTGLGVLSMLKKLGFTNSDLEIIEEVNESNWSKFDEEGQPFFDSNGKIRKGPDYKEPNLNKFIGDL